MSCEISQRVKPVSQCGTYRLFLFAGITTACNVIIERISNNRELFKSYTPVLITKNGFNISYVDILYSDFGEFLNSDSDFEISVDRLGEVVLIYLGLDSDSETILTPFITATFIETYTAAGIKAQIALENFEL